MSIKDEIAGVTSSAGAGARRGQPKMTISRKYCTPDLDGEEDALDVLWNESGGTVDGPDGRSWEGASTSVCEAVGPGRDRRPWELELSETVAAVPVECSPQIRFRLNHITQYHLVIALGSRIQHRVEREHSTVDCVGVWFPPRFVLKRKHEFPALHSFFGEITMHSHRWVSLHLAICPELRRWRRLLLGSFAQVPRLQSLYVHSSTVANEEADQLFDGLASGASRLTSLSLTSWGFHIPPLPYTLTDLDINVHRKPSDEAKFLSALSSLRALVRLSLNMALWEDITPAFEDPPLLPVHISSVQFLSFNIGSHGTRVPSHLLFPNVVSMGVTFVISEKAVPETFSTLVSHTMQSVFSEDRQYLRLTALDLSVNSSDGIDTGMCLPSNFLSSLPSVSP